MSASSAFSASGRIHSLDGLRAFSILLVLVGHAAGTVGAPDFLKPFHGFGNYGVRFFFVISGFLITSLLLRELGKTGSIDFVRFFYRRVLRIFPAFYAYIAVGALLTAVGVIKLMPGDLLHAATYTMNYHEDRAWHFNHTWSLAVEEQFYLIWPLALFALGRRRAFVYLLIAILAIPMIRAGMWYGLEVSPTAMMRQFQAVADALAMGCVLAYLHQGSWFRDLTNSAPRGVLPFVAAGLFVASAAAHLLQPGLFYVFGQTLANLATVLVIHLALTRDQGFGYAILNHPVTVYVGTLSYSLYLWQEPFLNSYETAWPQSFPVNVGLAFCAAVLSYHLIEKPFLALKDRGLGKVKPVAMTPLQSQAKGYAR